MDDEEAFLDLVRADEPLRARIRAAVRDIVAEDPEVSPEELGWAAVDLASATTEVPDDMDLAYIGESIRMDVDVSR